MKLRLNQKFEITKWYITSPAYMGLVPSKLKNCVGLLSFSCFGSAALMSRVDSTLSRVGTSRADLAHRPEMWLYSYFMPVVKSWSNSTSSFFTISLYLNKLRSWLYSCYCEIKENKIVYWILYMTSAKIYFGGFNKALCIIVIISCHDSLLVWEWLGQGWDFFLVLFARTVYSFW